MTQFHIRWGEHGLIGRQTASSPVPDGATGDPAGDKLEQNLSSVGRPYYAGFTTVRRATTMPLNMVVEARL